jgi:beta-lactamase class A
MTTTITRRAALLGASFALPALVLPVSSRTAFAQKSAAEDEITPSLAKLQRADGGRLGVAALDTGSGKRIAFRADERFPMCSTFKVLAAGYVLSRIDDKQESLDRRVVFTQDDLVPYSPATEKRVGGEGMSIAELCEAAITLSDNTAGNLLLASFGGPAALTAFARSIGDAVTRLDRIETELNDAAAGDPRDTTSPVSMLHNLNALVLDPTLSRASRDLLIAWLVGNRTGDTRLRAGLPAGWRVGDKTGSGENGTANDIAVIWPPQRAPILLTVYLTQSKTSPDARNALIAEVGRLVAASL